jgi:F-type H+-transporting ATPase subunit b
MEFLQLYIYPYINFLLFIGILFYAGRKAIQEIFASQKKDFELAYEAGQASLNSARSDQASIIERMNGLELEIKRLRDSSLAVTNSEVNRLREDTNRSIEHLRSDAQRIAKMELEEAQKNMRKSVVGKAVKGVEAGLIQSIRGRDLTQQESLLSRALQEFEASSFVAQEGKWAVAAKKTGTQTKQNNAPVS